MWPAVPGDRQRLQPAVGEFDEVLLQRIDAEGVFHLERGELAVRTVGLDQELSVLAEEARMHAVIVEAGIVEIAEHRFVGRVVHRVLVLRAAPKLRLRLVAAGAGLAADKCGDGRLARIPGRVAAVEEIDAEPDRGDDHCSDRCRNPDRAP